MPNKKKEPEIIISDSDRKRLWAVMLAMQKSNKRRKETEKLVEALICYQTYIYKLYMAEGMTWQAYLMEMEYALPTVKRFHAVAKFVTDWAMETYPPKPGEIFIVNEIMVAEFVGERQSKGAGTDFESIMEDRRSHKLFLQYLEGEETMSFDEFKKAMTIKRRKSQEAPAILPEQTRAVQFDEDSGIIHLPNPKRPEENLFSTHEKIIKAGFKWEKETGKYLNPDGSLMTRAQKGEFTDPVVGLKVYDATVKKIEETIDHVVQIKEQWEEFHLAFKDKHTSPNDIQLIKERQEELQQKLHSLVFEVSRVGSDSEEAA